MALSRNGLPSRATPRKPDAATRGRISVTFFGQDTVAPGRMNVMFLGRVVAVSGRTSMTSRRLDAVVLGRISVVFLGRDAAPGWISVIFRRRVAVPGRICVMFRRQKGAVLGRSSAAFRKRGGVAPEAGGRPASRVACCGLSVRSCPRGGGPVRVAPPAPSSRASRPVGTARRPALRADDAASCWRARQWACR
ncbi:hypothetical protein [Actinomadura flavalba]|uniref:hypothetical protein n=1 Tax=Actinomadura flavalba TaxID=1120938 RepID=UPI0012DCCFB7|nr:hypothetical protein [Actinomadura flavalba]